MYTLQKSQLDNLIKIVNKKDGEWLLSIPFVPDNTDYQQFKKDIMAGGQLQDADGNLMSPEAAKEFVRTLP